MLRATVACNFSSFISPDGSAPAALGSLLSTSGATNHWKNTVVCHFSTFSHTCIFFLLTLSLLCLIFSLLLFSSLTLPTSAFSSVHIVGSLTSKKILRLGVKGDEITSLSYPLSGDLSMETSRIMNQTTLLSGYEYLATL